MARHTTITQIASELGINSVEALRFLKTMKITTTEIGGETFVTEVDSAVLVEKHLETLKEKKENRATHDKSRRALERIGAKVGKNLLLMTAGKFDFLDAKGEKVVLSDDGKTMIIAAFKKEFKALDPTEQELLKNKKTTPEAFANCFSEISLDIAKGKGEVKS